MTVHPSSPLSGHRTRVNTIVARGNDSDLFDAVCRQEHLHPNELVRTAVAAYLVRFQGDLTLAHDVSVHRRDELGIRLLPQGTLPGG